MPFTAYITLARDIFIVLAVAFIGLRIYTDGKNAVHASDLKTLQTQLIANAQLESQWAQEARHAQIQRTLDMDVVAAAIRSHSAPVFVRVPSSSGPVSEVPAPTPSGHPASGGADEGPQLDLRPALNAFALKYEAALADCRASLASWPQ